MRRKIKVLVVCVLAAMLTMGFTGLEAYAEGTDTVTISSADDLQAFAERVNNGESSLNAELTKDIDMTGKTYTPIGVDADHVYSGTFNGNGHTVTLYIPAPPSDPDPELKTKYVGLFGYIKGATIKNVGVEGTIGGYDHVGGIAGYAGESSMIENCRNTAEIIARNMRAGGIAGDNSTNSSITNCYNTGNVTAYNQAAGGITGYNFENSSITNCYNTGTVTAKNQLAGGIAGYTSDSSITNCYNTGDITSNVDYGEIVGDNDSSTITNCYYLSDLSGDDKKTSEQFNSGEVTWLLNGSESDGVWKQTLEEDKYPSFTGLTVCYDETKKYYNTAPKPSIASSSAAADNITIELDNYKDGKYGNVQYKLIADSKNWTIVEDLEGNSFAINGLEAVEKYTIYLKYTGTDQIPASDDGVTEVSITTAKYTNSWTSGPSISGWTYGSTPNAPSATPTYPTDGTAQDVTFTYYTDEDCAIITTKDNSGALEDGGQPVNAGIYYMIASVESGDTYESLVSEPIEFTINKAPQDAPKSTDFTVTNETIDGIKDGKISGLSTDMEYATTENASDSDYIKITDTDMTFASGTYYIRYAEKPNYNASSATEVTIGAGRKLTVTVPEDQTGYTLTVDKAELSYDGETTLRFKLNDGYSKTDDFSIKVNDEEITLTENNTYTISNVISDVSISVSGVVDNIAPTGTIEVSENKWTSFLNDISFEYFFKGTQTVTITGEDAGSGIASICYYVSNKEISDTNIKSDSIEWKNYENAFSINPSNKCIIYAKITDDAGNIRYISSNGIVIYTDAVSETTELSYVKGQTDSDLTVTVKLNDNTVSSISNDNEVLENGKDYTISSEGDGNSVIAIKKSYLEGLEAGDYKLTIGYKPLGVDYEEKEGNAAPEETSIALKVRDLMIYYTVPTAKEALTYNGNAQSLLNGGEAIGGTVYYSIDGENWSTDIPTATDAGTYTVYYKIEADELYSGSVPSTEIDVTVGSKELTDSMVKLDSSDNSYVFDGKDITPTVTVSDEQDGENFITGNDYEISGETSKLAYGTYTITVTGQNNYTGAVDVTWNITDPNAPTGMIEIDDSKWPKLLKTITFGLFFNETKTVTITGADGENESGIGSISYHTAESPLVGEDMTYEKMLEVLNGSEWKELVIKDGQGSFDIDPDARLIIYAKISDKAGNITYISSDGIVLDATGPVITGVTDGATYYTSQKVTITDENLDKVTVNGDEIGLDNGQFMLQGNMEKTYKIIATDKAGNSIKVTVTMKKTAAIGEAIQDITPENVTSEDIDAIRDVINKVEQQLDDENLTDEEREALEELRDKAESMLEKLEETAAEIEAVKEIIGGYDEESVSSEDKKALSEAIDRIKTLLESGNLTDQERAELEKLKEKAEALITASEKKEAESEENEEVIHFKDAEDKPEQKSVFTGDDGMYRIYGILALLSAGVCVMIIRKRKRQ